MLKNVLVRLTTQQNEIKQVQSSETGSHTTLCAIELIRNWTETSITGQIQSQTKRRSSVSNVGRPVFFNHSAVGWLILPAAADSTRRSHINKDRNTAEEWENGENSPGDAQTSEAGVESGFLNLDLKGEKKKIPLENNPPIEWHRLKKTTSCWRLFWTCVEVKRGGFFKLPSVFLKEQTHDSQPLQPQSKSFCICGETKAQKSTSRSRRAGSRKRKRATRLDNKRWAEFCYLPPPRIEITRYRLM